MFSPCKGNSYGWNLASKYLLRVSDMGTGVKFTVDNKGKAIMLLTSFCCLFVDSRHMSLLVVFEFVVIMLESIAAEKKKKKKKKLT